jgi:hypothetical protein
MAATPITSETLEKSVKLVVTDEVTEANLLKALEKVGAVEELKFVDKTHAYCIFQEKQKVRAALQSDSLAKLAEISLLTRGDWESMHGKPKEEEGIPRLEGIDPQLLTHIVSAIQAGLTPKSDPMFKIAFFSGTDRDSSFETWEYDVKCLVKEGVPEGKIKRAIRRSLKGEPASILVTMGEEVTVAQILEKFKGIFGPVKKGGALLQQFCLEEQREGESVATWGCRLENQMTQLLVKGKIKEDSKEEMLKTKLWSGLRNSRLKEATRHQFDSGLGFDKLFVSIRETEQELGFIPLGKQGKLNEGKFTQSHPNVAEASVPQVPDENQEVLKSILARIEQIEVKMSPGKQQGKPYYKPHHTENRQTEASVPPEVTENNQGESTGKHFVCFRCGRANHVKIGCRQRFHIDGYQLNWKQ